MPMVEPKISRGLAELDPIRVVLALPAPNEEESWLEYRRNQVGTQRMLLEEEEAAIHKLKGLSEMPVYVVVLYAHWQRARKAAYHGLKESMSNISSSFPYIHTKLSQIVSSLYSWCRAGKVSLETYS